MKRGFPFQAKPPAAAPQQIEVSIELSQEHLRNCFVTAQVIGKTPTEVANRVMSIGFLTLQAKRLTEGLTMEIMAKEAQMAAYAAAPPEEKPKGEEDTRSPEERLRENRHLAGLRCAESDCFCHKGPE